MWIFQSSPAAGRVLSVLRMVVAFMFISAGTMKMFGYPSRGGDPIGGSYPFTQIGLAAIIEVVGGTLVLLGLATRPAAFIMSGEMAVVVLPGLRAEGVLPGDQWRRVGRALLLDSPLPVVRRGRPLEPRRAHQGFFRPTGVTRSIHFVAPIRRKPAIVKRVRKAQAREYHCRDSQAGMAPQAGFGTAGTERSVFKTTRCRKRAGAVSDRSEAAGSRHQAKSGQSDLPADGRSRWCSAQGRAGRLAARWTGAIDGALAVTALPLALSQSPEHGHD